MEIQTFPTYQTSNQSKGAFMSIFDDIPSFEEAFDSDSLKKFYQQPTEFSSCCDSPNTDDTAFEVETQASPLLRYLNKFTEETPLPGLQFAINLNQIFESADMTNDAFPESFLQKDSYEPLYAKPMGELAKQSPAKLPDARKVFEMKGKLSMTVSNGNFTLKGAAQSQDNLSKAASNSSTALNLDGTSNFERLILAKRIFKIQKDVKSKCPTKLKNSSQGKNKAVSSQSTKLSSPVQKETSKNGNGLVSKFIGMM